MMPWSAVRRGRNWDLVGPVGDTLRVKVTADDDDEFDWLGWTWAGTVRQNPASPTTVGSFSITDTSSPGHLELVATVPASTTAAWASGDAMHWAIVGTKSGHRHTVASGLVKPTPGGPP